jgi:glycerol-3-phosphate dehydrogenase
MSTTIHTDIVIIGGGIAGLWLLNRVISAGYSAVLFESHALGSAQTIASQGMIHGGIKYALSGALNSGSEAIAAMPDHWRRCLAGEGDVDLRNTKILSDHFYLWSSGSLTSKLTSFFASKMARGRVEPTEREKGPDVFRHTQFRGHLYKLVDLVLDVPSLLNNLADNVRQQIFSIDWKTAKFSRDKNGAINALHINQDIRVEAQRFVFSAGEGNEFLMQQVGVTAPAMQRRPLKQVLVKHDAPYSLYAHCMGSNPSPRLTVSSHRAADGKWVWYLGGDLATEGTHDADEVLIAKAKKELRDLFGWVDFGNTEWQTIFLNRAEPKQSALLKPDQAFAETAKDCENLIVAWPTKLTLAPDMTNRVMSLIANLQKNPLVNGDALNILPKPQVATALWESEFVAQVSKV